MYLALLVEDNFACKLLLALLPGMQLFLPASPCILPLTLLLLVLILLLAALPFQDSQPLLLSAPKVHAN
jgi:hypothetical protein